MSVRKYVGANLPLSYHEAMDTWRAEQGDSRLTKGDALEFFVAKGLGMELPSFANRPRPSDRAARDERGELYCQLHMELGSYAAVAREVGLSTGRVRQIIARYERENRTPYRSEEQ